jgi:NAD(P)-dependent dehydrogenase (short-subunit alcohol dehydrogenase family)
MKILVIGVDSDIGTEISIQLTKEGHFVETTSRNGKGTYDLELAHPLRWPKIQVSYDIIYYCVGIDDLRSTRIEVMQINALMAMDCISAMSRCLKPGGTIVCLTTAWASMTQVSQLTADQAARSTWYKMSRSAFNMGIVILSRRFQDKNWMLIHPGVVRTKGTSHYKFDEYKITPAESAAGIIKQVSANNRQLSYIDYSGKIIPF